LNVQRKRLVHRIFVCVLLAASTLFFPPLGLPARHGVPLAPLPAPTERPSFGLNSHLATRYPDPQTMAVPAQIVADMGVGWVREDFHWHRVQPNPVGFDWTFTDAAMRALLQRNVQILGVLGPSVGWATAQRGDPDNDVSYYPPDPQAFAEYARAVVRRYHRYIHHWEVWNEPDHNHFWQPRADPAAYTQLLKLAAAAIREEDPDAKILVGGTNPFDTSFLRTVAANGAWNSFDIIAIHPYVDPWTPEDGNLLAVTDGVRTVAGEYGAKPIWATEVGWASGRSDRDLLGRSDEQTQASFLVRALLLLWNAGVERSFWYTLKDDPGNPYGLFAYGAGRSDFSRPKPAFYAFRTLNAETRDTSFVSFRSLFQQRTLLAFEGGGRWLRPSQPNGSIGPSNEQAHGGPGSLRIDYRFSNPTNDYVAFERADPLPVGGTPYALGLWVYGDGSGHTLRLWVRDAEGEVFQYGLGTVGGAGWLFRSAPLGGLIDPGNIVQGGGNKRVDYPVSVSAIILDDAPDAAIGGGSIYIDDLSAIDGREAYDMRLRRGDAALDILWSPPSTPVAIGTLAPNARVVQRDGPAQTQEAQTGRLRFDVGPAPMYVWHRR
jgi:hypothetical protein